MEYKLKTNPDKTVDFILKSNNSFVANSMPIDTATEFLKQNGFEHSDLILHHEIKSGDYFFSGNIITAPSNSSDKRKKRKGE